MQGFKSCFGDGVVDSLIRSTLIEDLHPPGGHIAFLCEIIQGVIQSAERECPSGHFGDLIPDPDPISLIF